MHSRLSTSALALVLLGALAGGCGKSTTGPGNTQTGDQAEVSTTLTSAASLVDDGLAEDQTPVSASDVYRADGGYRAQTAIRPRTWWQHVTRVDRTWDFAWADTDTSGRPTTCIVTLTKHMTGTLVIVPASATDSTRDSTARITKALDKTLTRRIMLRRLRIGEGRQWKVVEVTGAFVTTPEAVTHIVSIRFQSTSGVDTTITDPLGWHSLRHIMKFGTSDTVTATVTTLRNDDAAFIHRWDWRHRLVNNHDNTYSFRWVTTSWSGWRHLGLQAMSHGSIYDDALPFDSQAWHMPFRVQGGQPDVDYFPG